MVHIGTAAVFDSSRDIKSFSNRLDPVHQSVLIVRDDVRSNQMMNTICEFLDIGIEHAASGDDIVPMLRATHPIAVIADLDGYDQDGFHVMKMAAGYNRDLPVLLLGGDDPALLGAVDAVREVWGLTRVTAVNGMGDIGQLVDFLCRAARDAGMSRLMRV